MNTINNFTIDTSQMPVETTTRRFTIRGSIGSKCIVHVVQDGTIKYYDFDSQTFTNGHISNSNNLHITLSNRGYIGEVVFPTGGGTYLLTLVPLEGTELEKGSVMREVVEKQSGNSTVTFQASTANTSSYATFPTTTTTGALTNYDKFSFNWDITNASTDANGFGLIPINDYKNLNNINNLWFFTTTDTVDGAISPADGNIGLVVKVDDLTDIGLGSYISAVSAGSLVGNPTVTHINVDTKEVTINSAQTFADGITLTFRADGAVNIGKATGIDLKFYIAPTDSQIFTETNLVTKTIRAGSSGTTINLNGTYGVGHNDNNAIISGVGVTTASVQSVTASSSAGSVVVDVSQGTLTVGTPIYFYNIVQVFNTFGTISVSNYPETNKTIYLDIDKFLTPGTAS